MTVDRGELRELSKSLLGAKYQAEIGAAIADARSSVWGERIREALGDDPPPKPAISLELDRLAEAKLLVLDRKSKYDRRKLVKPADRKSAYWALCRELRRAASR